MNRRVIILKNIEEISRFIIKQWKETAEQAVDSRGAFSVALSGGQTPFAVYRGLSDEKSLPWNRTHVFMVDERFVPYESEENNYHMINRALLRHVDIPARNVHPVFTSELSPRTAAAKYEEDLSSFFKSRKGGLPEFDLILLGIGEDGHTASLFPGSSALKEDRLLAVAVKPPAEALKERITLTLPVINNAANIIFLVTGRNKAAPLKEVIEKEKSQLPASRVRPADGSLLFLADEDAGSLLPVRT